MRLSLTNGVIRSTISKTLLNPAKRNPRATILTPLSLTSLQIRNQSLDSLPLPYPLNIRPPKTNKTLLSKEEGIKVRSVSQFPVRPRPQRGTNSTFQTRNTSKHPPRRRKTKNITGVSRGMAPLYLIDCTRKPRLNWNTSSR